jgi:4'-phosphopantetheinyl transferase
MIDFSKYQILSSTILHSRLIDENKINLYINQLNNDDLILYNDIKSIKRKKEFITIRVLLKQYFKIESTLYYINQKPYLKNDYFISISHKDQELIIGINQKHQIGIDIEKINPKISKIKSKFCNRKELVNLDKNENIEILTKHWCAKEATFKCLDFQENIFLTDINVDLFSEYEGRSENKNLKFKLNFSISDNEYVICHAQKEN